MDVQQLKSAASGRWPEILPEAAGIDPNLLDGRHHPCPKCGGRDRFRFVDRESGACLCNQCFRERNGDGIAAVQWMRGCTFPEAINRISECLGLPNSHSANGNGHATRDIVEEIATRKRIPVDSFRAYGAHAALRGKLPVCRVPMFDETGAECSYFDLATINDKWSKGLAAEGKPTGLFLAGAKLLTAGDSVLIVEGVKDAAALLGLGFSAVGLPTKEMHVRFARLFAGCHVVIVPDRDTDGESGAQKTAARLSGIAASVKVATLPGELKGKKGADVRDILAKPGGERLLRQTIEDAREWKPDVAAEKTPLRDLDPMEVARDFLRDRCSRHEDSTNVQTLRFHHGEHLEWRGGSYRILQPAELRALVVKHVDPFANSITRGAVSNIVACIEAESILSGELEAPCWIGNPPAAYEDPRTILAARNGLFSLERLAAGDSSHHKPTPRYFTANVLDYDVDANAAEPSEWQQKILLVHGPRRSGKGTIGRVLRATIGSHNVAGPTLAGLGTNFGLWPLIGKPVGIISDARISGRTDGAIVTERLLSISGEDAQTIDRKNLPPVTLKLPTRFVILTNELPRLADSSGALAGRMLVLPLSQSFYGCEDPHLTERLLTELPGLLRWAVEGWKRLRDRGRFVQPEAGCELITEMEDVASPIGVFVRECCIAGPEYEIAVNELFEHWRNWCERVGRREPGTVQTFGRDLRTVLPSLKTAQRRDGNRVRVYQGIRMKLDF